MARAAGFDRAPLSPWELANGAGAPAANRGACATGVPDGAVAVGPPGTAAAAAAAAEWGPGCCCNPPARAADPAAAAEAGTPLGVAAAPDALPATAANGFAPGRNMTDPPQPMAAAAAARAGQLP
jgi:hypothetical protein